ncbi:MAG: hypothetical protein U1E53_13115 [Dongiaceae bacterium]
MPEIGNTSVFSQVDSSNNTATDPGFPENMPPSRLNDAARALQGAITRDWNWKGPTVTAGGTATVLTLTYSVAPAAYYQGMMFSFVVASVNTGAATINVNALGAKNITKNGTTALQGGELVAGAVACVMYDGTQMQLISNNMTEATAFWGGTSGGTANAQTVTLTPAPGAYYAGMVVTFLAGATNTGATTLNCNSLGAKSIFVANAACVGGEILSGKAYTVVYDGTQFQLLSPVATQHGGLIGVQVFSTPGTATYTPTAGTNSVVVEVVGGGGGGGGCATTGAGQVALGGVGGAGGYARERLNSGFTGVTVTVGAKGSGGAAGASNGTAGGTSSFGSLVSATGGGLGQGGSAVTTPTLQAKVGVNGAGSGGDINCGGIPGTFGIATASTSGFVRSGNGGSSVFGGGAIGADGSAAGNAALGYGSGGSGGANLASQATGQAGGNGSDGVVIIWEYS